MIKHILTAIIAVSFTGNIVFAAQRQVVIKEKQYVVHDNPFPVLIHRALPPYWNKHITKKELNSGRLPSRK